QAQAPRSTAAMVRRMTTLRKRYTPLSFARQKPSAASASGAIIERTTQNARWDERHCMLSRRLVMLLSSTELCDKRAYESGLSCVGVELHNGQANRSYDPGYAAAGLCAAALCNCGTGLLCVRGVLSLWCAIPDQHADGAAWDGQSQALLHPGGHHHGRIPA